MRTKIARFDSHLGRLCCSAVFVIAVLVGVRHEILSRWNAKCGKSRQIGENCSSRRRDVSCPSSNGGSANSIASCVHTTISHGTSYINSALNCPLIQHGNSCSNRLWRCCRRILRTFTSEFPHHDSDQLISEIGSRGSCRISQVSWWYQRLRACVL